jgi:hypothetical protein
MEFHKYTIMNTKKITGIVVLGDIHYGVPECDITFLKKVVKLIKKRGYYCILNGDLMDCGIKDSPGASVYENNISPKTQLANIINILKPISSKIICSNIGNHEARIMYSTSINLNTIIKDALNIKNGMYQTMSVVKIGKEEYDIFSMHGASNAMTTEGRVNSFKKIMDNVDSDVYLFSHCHDLHVRKFIKNIITNNGIEEKEQIMVLCGNFLDQSPYALMKGYPNLRKGCPLIKLYPNKHKIEVDLEWWKND